MEKLLMLPDEMLPRKITDKFPKLVINRLQDNFIKLMDRDGVSLEEVKTGAAIEWGTIYAWYVGDVISPRLDLNVKELADFFDVSIDFLAFGVKKYKFDTFDKNELKELRKTA